MEKPYRFRLGPEPLPPVASGTMSAKFWNLGSLSVVVGAITLFGEVMRRQPVAGWTGEPEAGRVYGGFGSGQG